MLDIGEGNVAATSLHESVHYIRINAPEEFNAMAKYVVEWLTRNGLLEEYLDRYASSYKLDNIYDLTEKMTADVAEALLKNADFVEDLFTDESFVKEICGENRTFAEKFVDALKSIIEAIKNYLKSGDVNHLIAGKLSEDVKALEKIEKLWRDALKAAVNNHAEISNAKENTDTQSNGVKYSLKEYTEHQKENWKDSKQIIVYENENQLRNFIQKSLDGEYLSVKKKMYFGAISTDLAERIFNETGVDAENYNITISSNEIRKILLNSHGDEKKKTLEDSELLLKMIY